MQDLYDVLVEPVKIPWEVAAEHFLMMKRASGGLLVDDLDLLKIAAEQENPLEDLLIKATMQSARQKVTGDLGHTARLYRTKRSRTGKEVGTAAGALAGLLAGKGHGPGGAAVGAAIGGLIGRGGGKLVGEALDQRHIRKQYQPIWDHLKKGEIEKQATPEPKKPSAPKHVLMGAGIGGAAALGYGLLKLRKEDRAMIEHHLEKAKAMAKVKPESLETAVQQTLSAHPGTTREQILPILQEESAKLEAENLAKAHAHIKSPAGLKELRKGHWERFGHPAKRAVGRTLLGAGIGAVGGAGVLAVRRALQRRKVEKMKGADLEQEKQGGVKRLQRILRSYTKHVENPVTGRFLTPGTGKLDPQSAWRSLLLAENKVERRSRKFPGGSRAYERKVFGREYPSNELIKSHQFSKQMNKTSGYMDAPAPEVGGAGVLAARRYLQRRKAEKMKGADLEQEKQAGLKRLQRLARMMEARHPNLVRDPFTATVAQEPILTAFGNAVGKAARREKRYNVLHGKDAYAKRVIGLANPTEKQILTHNFSNPLSKAAGYLDAPAPEQQVLPPEQPMDPQMMEQVQQQNEGLFFRQRAQEAEQKAMQAVEQLNALQQQAQQLQQENAQHQEQNTVLQQTAQMQQQQADQQSQMSQQQIMAAQNQNMQLMQAFTNYRQQLMQMLATDPLGPPPVQPTGQEQAMAEQQAQPQQGQPPQQQAQAPAKQPKPKAQPAQPAQA